METTNQKPKTTIEYIPLKKEIKRKGFLLSQIKRDGILAIYKQSPLYYKGGDRFEVIKIGCHDGFVMSGNTIVPAETYPTDRVWGTKGWTYKTLPEAEIKFNKISQNTRK